MSLKLKKHSIIPALILGVALPAVLLLWSARAATLERYVANARALPATSPVVAPAPAPAPAQPQAAANQLVVPQAQPTVHVVAPAPACHAGVLNRPREFALGMIETGNDDTAIGGAGEVSRYQIMPSVWRSYSSSHSYRSHDTAHEVASRHWTWLYNYFRQQTRREPTDFDMYVLWNTSHGYYAKRGFNPGRLGPVVRDRAERFSNLVEDAFRTEARLAQAGGRG